MHNLQLLLIAALLGTSIIDVSAQDSKCTSVSTCINTVCPCSKLQWSLLLFYFSKFYKFQNEVGINKKVLKQEIIAKISVKIPTLTCYKLLNAKVRISH